MRNNDKTNLFVYRTSSQCWKQKMGPAGKKIKIHVLSELNVIQCMMLKTKNAVHMIKY